MPRHHEIRLLPYTSDQMFDLVADVARYGEFLPWVSGIRVRSDTPDEMIADMIVGFKSLKETFTSRVTKQRPHHIHVDYLDGPLRHLYNDWKFAPASNGCAVDFTVDFEFKNKLFQALAGQVFDRALRKMIGAFEERAAALYGSTAPSTGINSSSATSAD